MLLYQSINHKTGFRPLGRKSDFFFVFCSSGPGFGGLLRLQKAHIFPIIMLPDLPHVGQIRAFGESGQQLEQYYSTTLCE